MRRDARTLGHYRDRLIGMLLLGGVPCAGRRTSLVSNRPFPGG